MRYEIQKKLLTASEDDYTIVDKLKDKLSLYHEWNKLKSKHKIDTVGFEGWAGLYEYRAVGANGKIPHYSEQQYHTMKQVEGANDYDKFH